VLSRGSRPRRWSAAPSRRVTAETFKVLDGLDQFDGPGDLLGALVVVEQEVGAAFGGPEDVSTGVNRVTQDTLNGVPLGPLPGHGSTPSSGRTTATTASSTSTSARALTPARTGFEQEAGWEEGGYPCD